MDTRSVGWFRGLQPRPAARPPRRRRIGRRELLLLATACVVATIAAAAAAQDSTRAVESFIGAIVRQTAAVCPLAGPADQAALDRCRAALFKDSAIRRGLAPVVLWGRPSPDTRRLADTGLTEFASDVISGLYLPLFMFTGEYEVGFDTTERLYRARVPAVFRNALDLGQYPYPFWHDAKKWADYQAANQLTIWIDPRMLEIITMQFSARGKPDPRLVTPPRTPPVFDGNWMWQDASGRTQPRPTLFVGLLRPDNPYLGQVEGAFRDLAGALRRGTCNECHAPDNASRMKRLVLMQTPVHAAGEIHRLMRAVREDKMPLDDTGMYKALDPVVRAALLEYGATFESLIDAARDWEARNP
jgi:hypothetical protein